MLRTRIITAVVLAPLAVAAIFMLDVEAMAVVLGALFTITAWEWGRLIWPQRIAQIAVPALTASLMAGLWLDPSHTDTLVLAAVAWWILAFFWLLRPKFGERANVGIRLLKTAIALLSCLAVWWSMSYLHAMHPLWLFSVLLLAWAADIAAYFVGRAYGKRKLAPQVSPGKTWAGAFGGVMGAIFIGLSLAIMFALPVPLWVLSIAFASLAAISIIGDLFASLMKRHAGAKDSSQLLPGHGGVLDRFDSLIAMVPTAVALHWWLL